jgi:hypothetical protein
MISNSMKKVQKNELDPFKVLYQNFIGGTEEINEKLVIISLPGMK